MCHVILCSLWFLQPFLPDVHSEGSPIAQVFWESIGGLPAVAMATEEIMAKAGPFELPNGGKNGTLTWEQRQEILRFTGVSAAVRERKQTKGIRHLTLSGPVAGIATAKKMAMEYVLTSQSAGVVFAETPGSEGDWKATERQPKKRKKQQNSMPKAMGCSNSSSTSSTTWNQQPWLGMQWPPWGMMPMMYPPAMPPMSMMCPMQMAACRSEAFDEPGTADFEEKDEEWPSWTDSQVAEFRGTTAKAPGAIPIKIEVKQEVCEHAGPMLKLVECLPLQVPVMGKEPRKKHRICKKNEPEHMPVNVEDSDQDENVPDKKKRITTTTRSQSSPSQCQVEISTCGWRQQGASWAYDFDTLMDGRNGVQKRLAFHGIADAHLAVDCRIFKDKNMPKFYLDHTGYHDAILQQTIENDKFPDVMQKTLASVADYMKGEHTEPMRILAVCTSGCHRSVSFSVILKCILEAKGITVDGPKHHSKGSWYSRGLCTSRMCTQCEWGVKKQTILSTVASKFKD